MTIDEFLKEAKSTLIASWGNDYRDIVDYEIQCIVIEGLKFSLTDLILKQHCDINIDSLDLLFDILNQRITHKPLAKILGYKHFWNDRFIVDENVLDPRPETELIIESVLDICQNRLQDQLEILDLGVGSGCILITLLKELSNACGVGVDISQSALSIAKKNATALNVAERVLFFQGDWLDCEELNRVEKKFDLIVTNPPYISFNDVMSVNQSAMYDPKIALFAEDDGLSAYKKIIPRVGDFLREDGFFICEIGCDQAEDVKQIVCSTELLVYIEKKKDYSAHDRVIIARKC